MRIQMPFNENNFWRSVIVTLALYFLLMSGCVRVKAQDAVNDRDLYIKRNIITGINTRRNPSEIRLTECERLTNIDLTELGKVKKRLGYASVANDVGNDEFTNIVRFNPHDGKDVILGKEGTNLRYWHQQGNWGSAFITDLEDTDFTLILPGNSECLVSDGISNFRKIAFDRSVEDLGDGTDAPPVGALTGCYFKDRYFIGYEGVLYFSDAASSTFDTTTNSINVSVGDNYEITNLIPYKNNELVIFKEKGIWLLYCPTNTTPLSNWYLQPLDVSHGCPSRNAAVKVGDDIYFWSEDGVRTLRRNEEDKIYGLDVPISDPIYNNYVDSICYGSLDKVRAVYYKNRVIFAVPYNGSQYCNYWFVYHLHEDPSHNGWTVFNTIDTADFCVYPPYNETEKLYFSDGDNDGVMYEMFTTQNDNGSAISAEIITRVEDFLEKGLEGTRKHGKSLFIKVAPYEGDTLTIEGQEDEGGWESVASMDMSNNAPTWPVTLPVELLNAQVVKNKYHLNNTFERWYNIQLKFSNNTAGEGFEILEWMYVISPTGYEQEVQ